MGFRKNISVRLGARYVFHHMQVLPTIRVAHRMLEKIRNPIEPLPSHMQDDRFNVLRKTITFHSRIQTIENPKCRPGYVR